MDNEQLKTLLSELDAEVLKTALIDAMSGGTETKPVKKPAKKTTKKTTKKANKKKPVSKNAPEDFMAKVHLSAAEKRELEAASQSDAENRNSTYEKFIKRTPVTKIEVRCKSCGKTENIYPSMIPPEKSRYKCNNCSTHAG